MPTLAAVLVYMHNTAATKAEAKAKPSRPKHIMEVGHGGEMLGCKAAEKGVESFETTILHLEVCLHKTHMQEQVDRKDATAEHKERCAARLAILIEQQHMLSNRRYIGEYKYRDILIPDGIPAIVPEDLFDRVQEKLAQNRKAPARHKAEDDYLLTTKLFCGYCGAYLCGESGKSRNGTVHHYYKCVSVKKKRTDCKKKPVRKQWLEDLVVNEVMKVVMDDQAIEAIVSMVMDLQDRENTSLPLYEQQLREAETGIQNLLNAIQQGILTKSTKSRLEELEATKEDLEIKIANEKIAKPRISPEFVTFWLHKFRKQYYGVCDYRR